MPVTARHRAQRAFESLGNAAEAIGPLSPGMSVFAVTRGQWSMIDAILHCLNLLGPSAISVWVWMVAAWELEQLLALAQSSHLTDGVLVVDRAICLTRRNSATLTACAAWQARFGDASVRYLANHAKLVTLTSQDGMRLLLRGSMNLNFNPRFEQFDLTEGGEDYALVKHMETELPVITERLGGKETRARCGITAAMTSEQVQSYQDVPRWKP